MGTSSRAACVPLIETPRLILRAASRRDFPTYLAMMSDENSPRTTTEDAWRRFTSAAGLWLMLGYGYWSIERKCDGEFIGRVGFGEFFRGVQPSIDGLREMGWRIRSDLWGRGYASEAVGACLDWADEHLTTKVVAIINDGNAPSIRVAEKVGFRRHCIATYKDAPIILFERQERSSRIPI